MDRVKDANNLTRQQKLPENGQTGEIRADSTANFTPPPTLPLFEPGLKDRNRGLGIFDGPRAIRPKQQIHLIIDPPASASRIPNSQGNSSFIGASEFVVPHQHIENHRATYNQPAFKRCSPGVASNIQHPRNNSPFLRRAQGVPRTQNIHTSENNCDQRGIKKVEIQQCGSGYSNTMRSMMHMGSTAPAKPRASPSTKKTSTPSTPPLNHAVAKKKSGHVSEMASRFNYNTPPSAGTPVKKSSPPKSTERYNKPLPQVPAKPVISKNTETSAPVDNDEVTLIDNSLERADDQKSLVEDSGNRAESGIHRPVIRKSDDADSFIMGTPTKGAASLAEMRKNTLTSPTKYMPPGSKPARKAVGTTAIKKSPAIPSTSRLPIVAKKPKSDIVVTSVDYAGAATRESVPSPRTAVSPPSLAQASPKIISSSPVIDRLTRPTFLSAAREANAKANIQSRKPSGTMNTIKNAAHRMKNMMHSSRASRKVTPGGFKAKEGQEVRKVEVDKEVIDDPEHWSISYAGSTATLNMPATPELLQSLREHLNVGPSDKLEQRFVSLQDKLGFITHLVSLSSNKWLRRGFMLRETRYKDHLLTSKLNQIRLSLMALRYKEVADEYLADAAKWEDELDEAIVHAHEHFSASV